MGEVSSVLSLLRYSSEVSDDACLRIVDPFTLSVRRNQHLLQSSSSISSSPSSPPPLPSVESWRFLSWIGISLDNNDHLIRTNSFRLSLAALLSILYHYEISIYRYDYDGNLIEENLARKGGTVYSDNSMIDQTERIRINKANKENTASVNVGILRQFLYDHSEIKFINNGNKKDTIGLAYNGFSSFYSTSPLDLPYVEHDTDAGYYQTNVQYPSYSTSTYSVVIEFREEIEIPRCENEMKKLKKEEQKKVLNALMICISCFAIWEKSKQSPEWIIIDDNDENNEADEEMESNGRIAFSLEGLAAMDTVSHSVERLGYYYSLKTNIHGELILQTDVIPGSFLKDGSFLDLFASLAGYSSGHELITALFSSQQLVIGEERKGNCIPNDIIEKAEELLNHCRVRLIHMECLQIFDGFGPPASSEDSSIIDENGNKLTIEEYYEMKARIDNSYQEFLPTGKLQYPFLPTIRIQQAKCSEEKISTLIPIELVEFIAGQVLARSETIADIEDDHERSKENLKLDDLSPNNYWKSFYHNSLKDNGLLSVLMKSKKLTMFGFNKALNLSHQFPIKIQGFILPPPKLQYKNKTIEPELKGSWSLSDGIQFAISPPFDTKNVSKFLWGISILILFLFSIFLVLTVTV
jgi:hypothetical protein